MYQQLKLLFFSYSLRSSLTFLFFLYFSLGDIMNVDTTMFRRAVWNYIHCMYGIRHDDYNYGEVNQMLERNLKAYIKTVTCYPERLTKKDYDNVMREFKHSEKVSFLTAVFLRPRKKYAWFRLPNLL